MGLAPRHFRVCRARPRGTDPAAQGWHAGEGVGLSGVNIVEVVELRVLVESNRESDAPEITQPSCLQKCQHRQLSMSLSHKALVSPARK